MPIKTKPPTSELMERIIAVDVDGTLIQGGEPNLKLISALREYADSGYELILWSSRGGMYARCVADELGIVDLFSIIISKPKYTVDNWGWSWVRFSPYLPVDGSQKLPSILQKSDSNPEL